MNKAILQTPDVRDSNDIRLQFIRDICNDPNSKPFRYPVDENRDQAKNYYQIILTPMDLDTLESLVKDYQISDHGEFIQKLNLIWENAMKYNANENHTVHKKAKQMKILTHKLIKKYFSNLDNVKNIIPTRKSNRIKKRQEIKLNEAKENEPETLEKDVASMLSKGESAELDFEYYPELHISNYDGNKRSAAPSLPPEVQLTMESINNVPQPHIPSYDGNKRSAAPSLPPPFVQSLPANDTVQLRSNDVCIMQGSTELHQAHSSTISCGTAKSHEEEVQHLLQIIATLRERLDQKNNTILSLNRNQNSELKQLLIKLKVAFMAIQLACKEVENIVNSLSMRNLK